MVTYVTLVNRTASTTKPCSSSSGVRQVTEGWRRRCCRRYCAQEDVLESLIPRGLAVREFRDCFLWPRLLRDADTPKNPCELHDFGVAAGPFHLRVRTRQAAGRR